MNREPIRSWHLERLAFVYLRQSSLTQVKRNTEGEERQRRHAGCDSRTGVAGTTDRCSAR